MNYKAVPIKDLKIENIVDEKPYDIIYQFDNPECRRGKLIKNDIERIHRKGGRILIQLEEIPASSPPEVAVNDGVYSKKELRDMLEDVVNELDLSESMVEKHGPLGTAPAALVREVLKQKDLKIRALEAGFKPIILSSTPKCKVTEEEIREALSEFYQVMSVQKQIPDIMQSPDKILNTFTNKLLSRLSSPLNTNEEKEVELMDCECGHRVPHKFATFNGEHYTCMECYISWLEGLLAKADNTDEGVKELFDTHSAPYEDNDGNIQYAMNIHDFRRSARAAKEWLERNAKDLEKQSLSAKEKGLSSPLDSDNKEGGSNV